MPTFPEGGGGIRQFTVPSGGKHERVRGKKVKEKGHIIRRNISIEKVKKIFAYGR
jgi:hypothetical protein